MAEVIEWVNPDEKDIIWKHPNEEIGWGSQIVVREFEAAVFFRDGKAYDVFTAGRHMITTMNLPLLTGVLKTVMGYEKSPFKATVIFISLRQFQGQFGGKGMSKELAPVSFYGAFWFKVKEPNQFVNEVVGGRNVFETKDFNKFIRGYFNESFLKKIGETPIVAIMSGLEKMSLATKASLQDDFSNIGLELLDVKFEGLDTTDEWRDRIFWLQKMGPEAAGYVLQMETLEDVSKELGKSPGAALGAGMAIIPGMMGPAPKVTPPKTGVSMISCPSCKKEIPKDSKFCPHCGAKLVKTCPNGHEVPEGSKFCPTCGAALFKKCPDGHEVPLDAKFCPVCGKKVEENK